MAPIAKIFHNLPELSDDFRRLLKDLMDSAPDELPSTQVRVAADLTDIPYDEGLRRMAQYLDDPVRFENESFKRPMSNLLHQSSVSSVLSGNPYSQTRLSNRLGRELTDQERIILGDLKNPNNSDVDSIDLRQASILYRDIVPLAEKTDTAKDWLFASRRARREAQKRMALEYLLEGLL